MKAKQTLEDFLTEQGMTKHQLKTMLENKNKSNPTERKNIRLPFDYERNKFLVISDLHMGHKNFREDILDDAVNYSRHEKCEFVLIPGDILEGMSGRDGQIYELNKIGATQQMDYAVEQLSKFEIPIYGMTATNSHDGWYASKGNMGYEVGPELARRIPNFNFLGYDEVNLTFGKGIQARLSHPGDGTAYAISYKLQKYINSLSGGQKPNLLFEGHYHKALYMFYRGIHAFDCATLEAQTIFMKKMQTPAMLGYWVIDVQGKNGNVDRIKPEFTAYFE
jgi:predicted phosphodiesterase